MRRAHVERLLWFAALVAVTALAVWLRQSGGTTGVPDGDEALYFALARDFEPGLFRDHADEVRQQLASRPLFFALWHLPARHGLETAQLLNQLVSAAVPLATIALARGLGHGRIAALAGGLAVATHATSIATAWVLYPDTTAVLLATLGAAAFVRRRWVVALALLVAAVATKEIVAVVPLALLPCWCAPGLRRTAAILAPLAALAAVAAITYVQATYFRNVQGWGGWQPHAGFWREVGVSLGLVPIGLLLVAGGRWREILLWLAFPLFFFLWVELRRRGVNSWYPTAAGPMLGVAVAGAFDVALGMRHVAARAGGALLVGAFLLSRPAADGLAQARAGRPRQDDMLLAVAEARSHRPTSLALIDTFWAYHLYPFDIAPVIHRAWPDSPEAGLALARGVDVAVVEVLPENQALREALAPCGRDFGRFWVYVAPATCGQ